MELGGVIPAIITPMNEQGRIDTGALEKQTAYLADSGVHGFLIGGTTAEGAYLSTDELRVVLKIVRGISRGRQFICAASLRPSTAMVQAEIEALADLDPDYLVVIAPYYLSATQDDIKHHFREVLKAACAPLIVYNIPSTTHNLISLETVLELADEPRIAGTKDSTGDFIPFSQGVLNSSGSDFSWFQGQDFLFCASLFLGAQGLVSGLCNVHADNFVAMYQAAQEKDWETVKTKQRSVNRLFKIIPACGGRVIPAIKAAVCIEGRCQPWMRNQYMSPSASDLKAVEKALASIES